MLKLGIITAFLGRTRDRFHEYNTPLSLEEKFALMADIEGKDGVELIYPYEASDATEVKRLLDKYALAVAAVNVNVKAEPEFVNGGLTSPDPAVRARAVQFIKDSKDFAETVGADKVTCCPLGDGFEFSFQYDYAMAWKRLIETFGEAGDYKNNIPLHIEYKPSETRGRCFLDNAAKTLCLLNDIKPVNMGVTLDFGHSIYGNEHPAEAVALISESPYRLYVHINDNDGRWDWDYFCGTKHYLEYVEFLYYLRRYGYNDYLTSDTSPTRWDIKRTFEANARLTNAVWALLENLEDEFTRLMRAGDYLATWRFIESEIFKLK
jgi:xylose isomerase